MLSFDLSCHVACHCLLSPPSITRLEMLRGVVMAGSPVQGEQQLAVTEQGWGSDEMWSQFLPWGPLADQGWLVECSCGSCPGWGWEQGFGGGVIESWLSGTPGNWVTHFTKRVCRLLGRDVVSQGRVMAPFSPCIPGRKLET